MGDRWRDAALNLTEADVRYAMENSDSVTDAAKWLKVSNSTFIKYASMYIDVETGKTLHEIQKAKKLTVATKRKKNKQSWELTVKGTSEIIEGIHPRYGLKQLKSKLIRDGFKAEECEMCGYGERRITDYTVPLILVWKDGDTAHTTLDNLELICYNCYYNTHGDIFNKRKADNTTFIGY